MVQEEWVPDWTDHWFCRAVDVVGALATASRVPLLGGERGVDMIVLLTCYLDYVEEESSVVEESVSVLDLLDLLVQTMDGKDN